VRLATRPPIPASRIDLPLPCKGEGLCTYILRETPLPLCRRIQIAPLMKPMAVLISSPLTKPLTPPTSSSYRWRPARVPSKYPSPNSANLPTMSRLLPVFGRNLFGDYAHAHLP